ncbi:MAG: Rieske (2Fe-2S) protein [Cycloclasticus sp.]
MRRRTFIKKCSLSALYLSANSSLLSGCQTNSIRYSPLLDSNERELIVSTSEFNQRSHIFLTHPTQADPICVYKTNEGEYFASLMDCTHQHCTVELVDEHFICPCHGSRFNLQGEVLRGPATKDLTRYTIQHVGNTLRISLR